MGELVAIDVAPGPAFVDALRRAWDRGAAVLPVDQRLPPPARRALLDAARPHRIASADGPEPVAHDPGAPLLDDGDALVIASSGTTGEPKLLVHTHASVAAHARAVHAHLGVDPERDRWLSCLPLAHVGGLGVVLRSLVTGTPLDVLGAFDPARVAAAPTELGSTLVSLVPTALDRLDAAGFRWVVLGGSGDAAVRPANVVHTYGLTETCGGVVYEGVPLPGVEVRTDEEGHVALRSPTLARGRRARDGTVVPVVDADGWLWTGDVGRVDAGGRLHVEGRADDLVVTGGENVWPTPVEAVLARHPAVADVAVAGRPDREWGQRVVALVVPADRAAPPTLRDLRDHVRASLPAYCAPRELVLVDAVPRTALGKVRRGELDARP